MWGKERVTEYKGSTPERTGRRNHLLPVLVFFEGLFWLDKDMEGKEKNGAYALEKGREGGYNKKNI